jgi:LuxR family transcriptional regulator, maltose regulon positive regulatory protein
LGPYPEHSDVATTAAPPTATAADDLLLKVTPPRAPRNQVVRARLRDHDYAEFPAVLVQAPAGFGKTSLLSQWRREAQAHGKVVAWVSAQPQDDPRRLVQALALAVRSSAGRPTFGYTLLEAEPPGGLEAVTVWLAELAHIALNVVLIVDEAERLPAASRNALAYLLRNAPSNLRVVVAARADVSLGIEDLVAYGQCVVVGPALLRFTLDETLALARDRLGRQFDHDAAARLHELAEGWPLGVQLAVSVIASSGNAHAPFSAPTAPGDTLRGRLMGLLLSNLEPSDLAFLTRVAILDYLHPDLCRALVKSDDAAERLVRLARDTPVFVVGEAGDWLRMHTLAHEALRDRFAALPKVEQAALHDRAAGWLAAHGLVETAARHALQAGQRERAYELAERSLYESMMSRGRNSAVLEWLGHLPADELDRRPRLTLAAAWSLALSERHEEAGRLVSRILAGVGNDEARRCECALILSGAAVFADDPDRFAELHDPWAGDPPLRDPLLLQVHANRSAFRTLLDGQPALARLRQQQAPRGDLGAASGYLDRWGEFIVGLSYLWEGQVLLADKLLRPTLVQAESQLGRRNAFTSMVAALLAAAVWELDRPAEATALLANRLDVIERHGLPETVLLGYRTMARIAAVEGAEHRAIELLGALHAAGAARALPRLQVASLTDQVRLHARRFRPETCRELCTRIDAVLADTACPTGPLWRRSVELLREVAQGYAAIAAQEWRRALPPLARAETLAREVGQGRLHIELMGLRAYALDRCGERSQPLLREAMDLAQTYGLLRVFDDAHPALGDWVRQVASDQGSPPGAGATPAPMRAPPSAPVMPRLRPVASTALTPKEREVLVLLARNLSNKEIGLAMQVGEETIKWHMKNLFAKLDAGTRKQVVLRARILGLLESDA